MPEVELSVCWKNHNNEVATQYKSLLENNFLVDCTLSAEGQSIKAHRLVLSACSPYFYMLFREETGKHAFVILFDASFEILKAVIEFMYRGETHISKNNLKAFLALGQSLQIKGLNALFKDNKIRNLSTSPNGNVSQCPPKDNPVTCAMQNTSIGHPDHLENYSQQYPNHLVGSTDAEHTHSSSTFEEYSTLCEQAPSTSMLTPLFKHHKLVGCDEMFADHEITVKDEPIFSVVPETRNKELNNFESEETLSGNFMRNINGRTDPICGKQHLKQFSSSIKSCCGNVESSVMPPSQQQPVQLNDKVSFDQNVEKDKYLVAPILVLKSEPLNDAESEEPMDGPDSPGNYISGTDEVTEPVHFEENVDQSSSNSKSCSRNVESSVMPPSQQQPLQLNDKVSFNQDVEKDKSYLPLSLVLKCEPMDEESEEQMNAPDVPGYDMSGTDGVTEPVHCEENTVQSSNAVAHPSEKDEATQNPDGQQRRPPQEEVTPAAPPGLQAHVGRRLRKQLLTSREWPSTFTFVDAVAHPSEKDEATQNPVGQQRRRLQQEKTSACSSRLQTHVCRRLRQQFLTSRGCPATSLVGGLTYHMRRRTGGRPHCSVTCGKDFAREDSLARHKRIHWGERPYRCDMCGVSFIQHSTLVTHKRMHLGRTVRL